MFSYNFGPLLKWAGRPYPGSSLGSGTWLQTASNENFAFILFQTEEIGILLASATPCDLAGPIDNIAAVPEPPSMLLVGCATLFATTRRRRSGTK